MKKSATNDLPFTNPFKLVSNTPLISIDTTLINFIDNDSVRVKHTARISKDKSELILDFKKEYDKKYVIEILPNAVTNFFEHTNDTLQFRLNTKKLEDYGKLFVTLQGVKNYPIIVHLLTDKEKIVEEMYATEPQKYDFINLLPGKYLLRIIYDENQNKKWDTGNFLLKKQPEKVIYLEFTNDVRANWEMPEAFIME